MNIVITGASSGIGKGFVNIFTRHGHAVLATARRENNLQALSQEMLEKYNTEIHTLALDLTLDSAADALFEHAVQTFGKVHMLINNAGMSPYQDFVELNRYHIHQIISLNILALTDLCHLFIPHMLDHGEQSHLVNVGSAGGYAPIPHFSVYDGSKHYTRIFTNMLCWELRGTNIKVSGVHPGGVLSEFNKLAGQDFKKLADLGLMTSDEFAEKTYPAIIKGRRVIVPGGLYKIAVLLGKILPFPISIRIMNLVYNLVMDKVEPTYKIESTTNQEKQ